MISQLVALIRFELDAGKFKHILISAQLKFCFAGGWWQPTGIHHFDIACFARRVATNGFPLVETHGNHPREMLWTHLYLSAEGCHKKRCDVEKTRRTDQ